MTITLVSRCRLGLAYRTKGQSGLMSEPYGQKQEGKLHLDTFEQISMLHVYARMVCSECDSAYQPYIVFIYNGGNTGKHEIYQLDD